MPELFKFFLEKIDFLAIAESFRKRKNRKQAARLHLILVQSYEIIEVYKILLDELHSALKNHENKNNQQRFYLNPSRIIQLLKRQSTNLQIMQTLIHDMMDELRVLDNKFEEAYKNIFPGKFSILFQAEGLLSEGRLSLVETGPEDFPANAQGEYRTLWFTTEPPDEDREKIEKYLYGWNGKEKSVVDVNIHDGETFFAELKRYFDNENPVKCLNEIEKLTENYRKTLLEKFSMEDILTEIKNVRRHYESL